MTGVGETSPNWIFITYREKMMSELLKPLHSLVFELMLRGSAV